MRRIAIVGGGFAGLAAAYELARMRMGGAEIAVTLYEASGRFGGIVETVREGGFVVECGPDAWVSEKPWARELAEELGLGGELIESKDSTRKTYVWLKPEGEQRARLVALPDGMRMMVPVGAAGLAAVDASDLFSAEAKASFRVELARAEEFKAEAQQRNADESVASFVLRHFGAEVLEKIGAPLLGGVFGGDVKTLSMRAVMPKFVALEREYGSLIAGLEALEQAREQGRDSVSPEVSGEEGDEAEIEGAGSQRPHAGTGAGRAVFTTLRGGVETLVEAMLRKIPVEWLRSGAAVSRLERERDGWWVSAKNARERYDAVLLAVPADVARGLMRPVDLWASELMELESSSAVIVAFCFADAAKVPMPPGFGYLVPAGSWSSLLAATFADQKFGGRVPAGGRLVRAYFGGEQADRLSRCGNDEIAAVARLELARTLPDSVGPLPEAQLTVVRRWPRALPQYGVGHLERMAELEARVRALGRLWLLGNGYRGVGLPDLVRDARAAARECLL